MSINPPELKHELDDVLNDEEKRERFRIEDDGSATWAMRKLAEIATVQKETEFLLKSEQERLKHWFETVMKPLRDKATFFESILGDYAVRERFAKDRKTITLPHGKISTRPAIAKWDIDNDTLMAFLKSSDYKELIKVKEEISLSALTRAFSVTADGKVLTPEGELVQGITIRPSDISVSINPTTE